MVGGYGRLGGCRRRDGRMEPGSGCHELCMNIYNLSYLLLALTLYWGSLIWSIRPSRLLDNPVLNVFNSKFRQVMSILVDEVSLLLRAHEWLFPFGCIDRCDMLSYNVVKSC